MADLSQLSEEELDAMIAAEESKPLAAVESSSPIVKSLPEMSEEELDEAIEFRNMAAEMSPQDLSIARLTGNKKRVRSPKMERFGAYLRELARESRPGETEDDRFKRLYSTKGGLSSREEPSWTEGVGRDVLQGATFGFGDEIVAGGTAALDSLVGDANFGDAYNQRLANERADRSTFREEYPVSSYGAEIAGAIPTAVMAPLNLLRGGKALQAAGMGAGQGAVYGFGQGEGGIGNRSMNAALGLGLGGAVGALGVPVGRGIANLTKPFLERGAAKPVGLTRDQLSILNRALNADESLTGAGARRLEAAGDDAMLADAGPGAARLLDTAIVESPLAARMATTAVEDRVTKAASKLTSALDDTLGAPPGVRTAAKDIAQSTRAARSDAYEAAYSRPIDYASDAGRNIESVLDRVPDRVMKDAIAKANEKMRVAGQKNQQIMANIADDGTVTFAEMPNVQQLDYIKRALGEMGAEGVDQFGRQTADGSMYSTLARNIKNATSGAVPEYATAVRLGGDKIERDNALRLGYDLLRARVTREVVKDFGQDISDEARDAAAQGLRSSIDDALANVKIAMTDTNMDAREAFKLIRDMSSRANREKVELLIGPEKAKTLFSQLDESIKAFELRANVARNSATAVRQSTAKDVSDIVQGGAWNKLREGEVINAPKAAVAAILGRSPAAKQKVSDDVYRGMVEALTGPRGAKARALLQKLQSIQPGIDQKTRNTANLISNIGSRNAPVTQIDSIKKALGAR